MLVREGFSARASWLYAGRYEPLCAAGALRYTPVEPGHKSRRPRQVKSIDEALRRLCPGEMVERDLPRTGISQWCGCTVTSSEGAGFIHTYPEELPEDEEHPAERLRHLIVGE